MRHYETLAMDQLGIDFGRGGSGARHCHSVYCEQRGDQMTVSKPTLFQTMWFKVLVGLAIAMLLYFAIQSNVFALDLLWDRNPDTPGQLTTKYHVYICPTLGCIPNNAGAFWVGEVLQPPVGQIPKYTLPPNMVGAVDLAAENSKGVSGPSVALPFSTVMGTPLPVPALPPFPKGLRLQP